MTAGPPEVPTDSATDSTADSGRTPPETLAAAGAGIPATPGIPGWARLATEHLDDAEKFYATLCGWQRCDEWEGWPPAAPGIRRFCLDGLPVADMCLPSEDLPIGWHPVIPVSSVSTVTAVADSAEGHCLRSTGDPGELGREVILADPEGMRLIITSIGTSRPEIARPGPGTAGLHVLTIGDIAANSPSSLRREERYSLAIAFYRDVFGWELDLPEDAEDLTVHVAHDTTASGDVRTVGAIVETPALASGYCVYFGTPDPSSLAADIAHHGGSTYPGGSYPGPRASALWVSDPQGAECGLYAVDAPRKSAPGSEPTPDPAQQ